jgi:hypothetical protein
MTIILISFALNFIATGVYLYARRELKKSNKIVETARRAISRAEKIPLIYTIIEPIDMENREHAARIVEAATNTHFRALLIKLREDAFTLIEKGSPLDVGNRIVGRIEGYNSVNAMLDLYVKNHADMAKKADQN